TSSTVRSRANLRLQGEDTAMNELRDAVVAFLQEVEKVVMENRWYSELPYPCELDNRVRLMIGCFRNSSEADRDAVRPMLADNGASNCLWTFAKRMATQGVRRSSEELIFDGLCAVVVEDSREDYRVTRMILSVIINATVRIEADPITLFEKAVRL